MVALVEIGCARFPAASIASGGRLLGSLVVLTDRGCVHERWRAGRFKVRSVLSFLARSWLFRTWL